MFKCWNLITAAEKAEESREAKNKSYEYYPLILLCEDVTKLKTLRVPGLNKYLNHHGAEATFEEQQE